MGINRQKTQDRGAGKKGGWCGCCDAYIVRGNQRCPVCKQKERPDRWAKKINPTPKDWEVNET